MTVFNDLKTRGVHDVLVAVTNGLNGMPEALGSVFATTSRRPASFTSPTTAWNMRVGRLVLSWLPRSGRLTRRQEQRPRKRGSMPLAEGPRGIAIPGGQRRLAQRLGSRDCVLCIPADGAQGDLHDECHRKHQRPATQDHQDPRPLPDRGVCDEAHLAGTAQHRGGLELGCSRLEAGDEPTHYPLRG